MIPSDIEIDQREVKAADELFGFLGRYVYMLQTIEGSIDEIIRLGHGFAHRRETDRKLAKCKIEKKIDYVGSLMRESTYFCRLRDLQGWGKRTEELLARLHAARERRNALLHSQYLFDFVKIGHPILRANDTSFKGEYKRNIENLNPVKMKSDLQGLALLLFEVEQYKHQVIALLDDPDG